MKKEKKASVHLVSHFDIDSDDPFECSDCRNVLSKKKLGVVFSHQIKIMFSCFCKSCQEDPLAKLIESKDKTIHGVIYRRVK